MRGRNCHERRDQGKGGQVTVFDPYLHGWIRGGKELLDLAKQQIKEEGFEVTNEGDEFIDLCIQCITEDSVCQSWTVALMEYLLKDEDEGVKTFEAKIRGKSKRELKEWIAVWITRHLCNTSTPMMMMGRGRVQLCIRRVPERGAGPRSERAHARPPSPSPSLEQQ